MSDASRPAKDPDYAFCLSLVPKLAQLNEDQKEVAQIEILKLLRDLRTNTSTDTVISIEPCFETSQPVFPSPQSKHFLPSHPSQHAVSYPPLPTSSHPPLSTSSHPPLSASSHSPLSTSSHPPLSASSHSPLSTPSQFPLPTNFKLE